MKSLVFGILGAMTAAVLWIVVSFVLPLAVPLFVARFSQSGGVGGAGAVISTSSILLAAVVGFVLGVLWSRRRPANP